MQDLEKKISQLSPEKREILLKKLKEKGLITRQDYERIKPREDQSSYPMSFAQERLWFLNQLNPDSPFYNIPAAIKIKGELNVNSFIQAFEKVVERHAILSAVFKSENEGPVQYLQQNKKAVIDVVEFSNLDTETQSVQLKKQINSISGKSFNLSEGPLFRASLVKLANDENIFIICFHHIIADGWSIGVFINDLLYLYKSALNGDPRNLPEPLDIQYFDFSSWQKRKLNKGEFGSQLEYWKKELKDIPEILDLPIDKPRRSIQTFKGRNYEFKIPKDIKQKLIEIAKTSNASMFMVFLAAFQLLLRRFSGQNDFGIGIPAANRNHPQIKNLIGFFVNSLVIRSNIDMNLTFRGLLEIVKEKVLWANENQDIPFEKIVESLGIKKDISHTPLFQVMFDYQTNPLNQIELPGISLEIIKPEVNFAKFDLLLLIEESKDEFVCSLEYNSDLFNKESIVNITSSFLILLKSIISKPLVKLKYQKLISESSYEKIVNDFNKTYKKLPLNIGIHNYFEEQVKINPEKVALEFESKSITYRELNKKANQLARYLKSKGIKLESTVGIALDRSFEQIISVIAIVKCGAAYVPIDTNYPPERISFMLKDSGLSYLIKTSNKHFDFNNKEITFLDIDTLENELNKYSAENLEVDINSNNVIYIMYTSGSTGVPKGVEVLHSGVMRLVKQNNFGIMENQNFLALSSFSFDASTLEIWGSLANGSKLILFEAGKIALSNISKIIREKNISFIFLTTGLFNALVDENLDSLMHVKQILTGGEVLSVQHAKNIINKSQNDRVFYNVYGPTENTTFTTSFRIFNSKDLQFSAPIGFPIQNTKVHILDENFNIQPVGVIGELCIGGLGLARGYHKSPAQTAEKFIPNQYSQIPGDRLYRTGDLAKFNIKGEIEFIGRIDNQVKLRGFRIELGEIESILREHEAIDNCVVVFSKNNTADSYLTAYLKFNPSNKLGIDHVKQYLIEKLPDHMIPSKFIEVDKFYLTANGKIDKKKLPSGKTEQIKNRKFISPRNDLEKYLINLWEEVLHVENVSVYDDFFELGGNSLKAAVLINRIQKDFNRETHVGVIFKAPRVAEFATYMFEYYPDVVKENFNLSSEFFTGSKTLFIEESKATKRISSEDTKKFKNIIKVNHPKLTQYYKKNSKAIFILSPPRSGSTLLRVMLAGNSKLFSPPELDLLSFDSLKQRNEFFRKKGFDIWLESIVRAVMELKKYDVTKAESFINELEEKNISTMEFYGLMQEWLGERLLVDKTPSYAMDYDLLERAEKSFDEPLYIHLIRHPYAMIYSFIEAKLDEQFFKYNHNFNRRELAELIWLVSNQNIISFSKNIPKERIIQIKFEDLVLNPEEQLKSICRFIGIEFSYEMLDIYKGNKMTDAVKKNSQMVGDFKFYLHRNIDTSVVDRWKNLQSQDYLGNESKQLAEYLGYEFDEIKSDKTKFNELGELNKIKRMKGKGDIPLSYSQQRLWFIDQLSPGMKTYNIPAAVKLRGNLKVGKFYESIEEIIRRHESLRTIFPSEEGKVKQVVKSNIEIEKKVIDLRKLGKKERDAEAEKIIKDEASKTFNLSEGPLVRIKLLRIENEEYIFLTNMHHIITDGWSVEIFVRELAEIYSSKLLGRETALKDLEIQYSDYSIWQREWMKTDEYKNQMLYWKEKLKNAPPLLKLPTDYPRPHDQSQVGNRISFEINENKFRELQDLAFKENTTLYTVLLAAFEILLYKYTDIEDILIGTPVAGRTHSELEKLIGLFVNTLVIRTNITSGIRITDLIKKIKTTVIEALSNQEIPFEKLLDELKIERSLSHSPLFQVMFVFNESSVLKIKAEGIEIVPVPIDLEISKFDINLVLTQMNNRIKGEIEYDRALYNKTTIANMISHYLNIISSIKNDPVQEVSSLRMLSDQENKEIVIDWNKTNQNFNLTELAPRLFEKQVIKTPDNIAVVSGNSSITYSDLNIKANQLANYLVKMGIVIDDTVVLYMERSVEAIIGLLAVWKVGAAYVPLDPIYPTERINEILLDSGAKIIITQDHLKKHIKGFSSKIVAVDSEWENIRREKGQNLNISLYGESLAYLIYTSGSTGKPKAVMIKHSSLVNLYYGLFRKIYSKADSQILNISLNAPLIFDASIQQIVMLLSGKTLHIVPNDIRLDGKEFVDFIRENRIDVLDCVPTQLKMLIENGLFNQKYWMPKIVLPGGEAIDKNTWELLSGISDVDFYNMYGPTECTVDTTISRITSFLKPGIGKPISNVTHYVLDKNMSVVPIGVVGELYIGGEGLARGYFNKPDLTAEKFVPNCLGSKAGERLYKSGDLVKYLSDGSIEYVGRLDNQIKLRGFRIELGEIESRILQAEGVKEAAVVIREDQPDIKRLVAYYSENENSKGKIESTLLREYLSEHLPEYMIPAFIVKLDTLPKLSNRKIDRKSLPLPTADDVIVSNEYLEPSTEIEEVLTKIWKEVLKLEKIGVLDNFFELGGDSILGIQVIAKANTAGIKLSPKNLFEAPTIRGLSNIAKKTKKVVSEQGIIEGIVSLTPIQRWFFELKLKNPSHWNQSILLDVKESLDERKLREAINILVEHHDVLRMKYKKVGNNNYEQYYGSMSDQIPVAIENINSRNRHELNKILEDKSQKYQESLNIEEGPIFRVVQFKVNGNEKLLIILHHLIVDGVSWRILMKDLQEIYAQLLQEEDIKLPLKTTSFKYWSEKLNEYAASDEILKELEYWTRLAGKKKLADIPVDKIEGENRENNIRNERLVISKEDTKRIRKELPKKLKSEIVEIILTAFMQALSGYTGRRKQIIGMEGHGREDIFEDVDISRTLGWFTTYYPVMFDFKDSIEITDKLKSVKEDYRKIPRKGIGFGILKYLSADKEVRSKMSEIPKPEIVLNYLGVFNQAEEEMERFSISKEKKGYERGAENKRAHLIEVSVSIVNKELNVVVEYNSEKHTKETIKNLLSDMNMNLFKLIETADSKKEIEASAVDFEEAEISDDDLDDLLMELDN